MNVGHEEQVMWAKGSPAYARVVLGEALRRRRIERGLSQAEVAAWLGQSQPKIGKLEGAELQKIKLAELNIIIDGLGFSPGAAEELRGYARTPYAERGAYIDSSSSSQSWNGKARAETVARQHMSYHGESWDGLAQHPGYMRRQFELTGLPNIGAAVKRRLSRQAAVYESERPGEFQFVVTEAALRRSMNDPEMMADQLEHVDRLAERDFISVQVVPFTASVATQVSDFTIMRFGQSQVMNDLVLVEHQVGAVILDEEDDVRGYSRVWTSLIGGALSEHESRQLIREWIERHRAQKKEK
jgi:transcriptional regulator with XRE-family HTH domain